MPKKPTRSHDGYGWYLTKKGYPRFFKNGRMKHAYVHRYEAAKMLGRPLTKDEQVNHGRGGKQDFSWGNLTILGIREHSWYSAKQAFWMKVLDVKAEKEFYATITQLEAEGVRTGL